MKIYQEIVKNTDMGIEAINSLRTYVEDEELMHKILCQREELKKIMSEAENKMSEEELNDSKTGAFKTTMLKMGVKINAMFDKTNSNIAEMLIEGTNMGINEVQKELNQMQLDGDEVPQIANELMSLYSRNITELRAYL